MNLKPEYLLKGGEYRVEHVLGTGGFGITYLAEQVSLGRKVAIKEFFMREYCERVPGSTAITLGSSGSRELVERFRDKFLKEARSIASLEHKNIVPIIDVFEENGTAYYVMKYVGGGSLGDKVKGTALPEVDAVRYIRQVASALDYVHSRRMMHLDVKPANVLLSDDNDAVLIDFGLAKQYDDAGTQTSSTPVGISHGYAPMEQYKRGGVGTFSPATDIYSLGATLYKLVTGLTPPDANDVADEGLPALPQHLSANVRAAIEAAMQFRRKDRPQSIGEFLEIVESGKMKDESDGVEDCPPVLRGTSAAEGVNDPPVTDDGETVVGNSSGSCHPERSEPSVDARRGQSQGTYKHANKEILPPSGRQNDKGGEWKDESGKMRDESGELRGERKEPGGSSKKRWAIIIAVLVIGAAAALFGTLSGGGSDDTAAERKRQEAAQTRGTINGHDYVDLGLSVKWATCNVGASSPEGYGNYYAWGETTTKSSYTKENSTTYGKQMSSIAGNLTWDVARKNWGSTWRLPTKAEFQELIDNCTWEWATRNGHNGYKVTSKKNGNSIFLPAAGWRYDTSSNYQGSGGYYWSATPHESYADIACSLRFDEGYRSSDWGYRYGGYSVRPVSQN